MRIPVFRDPSPTIRQVSVYWVPPVGAADQRPWVRLDERTHSPVTPRFGLDVKVGDTVQISTVGQTLQLDAIISRPAPETAPAPEATPATDTTTTP